MTSGEGILIVSTVAAQRRALLVLALTLVVGASRLVTETWAAGAFAIGKCGAYGQAFDYAGEAGARAAALKQCKGECIAVTMKRACAALAVDMTNPCGPHGYAVKPRISSSLNAATRKCYEFGGKECVIRAWACDAKG
jgi:Domain of unknown function (DUF4189)